MKYYLVACFDSSDAINTMQQTYLKMKIDFGEKIGIKKSSAQITELYKPEELTGKQILGVVNFPPRQIAGFMSEVLVLGIYSENGVVLIKPDSKVKNGDKLG